MAVASPTGRDLPSNHGRTRSGVLRDDGVRCRETLSSSAKEQDVKIGYAPGAYDLFHIGHLNVLRLAKDHCDRLVAGVVADDVLELTKGRRPVIPLAERLEIVRHIDVVDDVYVETQPDKLVTWADVRFDVIFKGDDWRGTPKGDKLEKDFASVGVDVHYFPYTVHTSSSMLRRALAALESGGLGGEERDGSLG